MLLVLVLSLLLNSNFFVVYLFAVFDQSLRSSSAPLKASERASKAERERERRERERKRETEGEREKERRKEREMGGQDLRERARERARERERERERGACPYVLRARALACARACVNSLRFLLSSEHCMCIELSVRRSLALDAQAHRTCARTPGTHAHNA